MVRFNVDSLFCLEPTLATKVFNDTSFAQSNPEAYRSLCREYLEEVQSKIAFDMPHLIDQYRFSTCFP